MVFLRFATGVFLIYGLQIAGLPFLQYYPAAELIFAGFFYQFKGAGSLSVDSLSEKRQVQIQKQPVPVN